MPFTIILDDVPSWFAGAFISTLAVLVTLGVAIVTPIVKLNTSITRLNSSVSMLNDSMKEQKSKQAVLEDRVDKHDIELENHDTRINHLEGK